MFKFTKILSALAMFIFGLFLGVISRMLDIYTQNLGNVFSQMAIWILIGTIISIYSSTKIKSMINVFAFCLSMLTTYYFVAFVTDGVYSEIYIVGWTLFAFTSPILAYFTYLTKQGGILSKFISIGIVSISILSSIVLFDKLRFSDLVINLILIYILFLKPKKQNTNTPTGLL